MKGRAFYLRILVFLAGLLLFAGAAGGAERWLFRKQALRVGVFSDSYWEVNNGYSYRILEDALALFKEAHPDVEVSYETGIMKEDYSEWLAEGFIRGDAPDVFFVLDDDLEFLAKRGLLCPLDDYLEGEGGACRECFYDAAFERGLIGDRLYTLPFECAPRLMFVNKTLLDRQGISMPEIDWTWEDLFRVCERVTMDTNGNGALDQFGLLGYTWKDAADSNGVQLFSDGGKRCNFNSPQMEEVLVFQESLSEIQAGVKESDPDFEGGNVAFTPMRFSDYRAYKSNTLSLVRYADFAWDCAPMPRGPSGDTLSELDTLSVGMNEASSHKDLAFELIRILTCEEAVQSEIFLYSEGISPLRTVTESEKTRERLEEQSGGDVSTEVMRAVMENASKSAKFEAYEEALQMVDRSVTEVLTLGTSIPMEMSIQEKKINLVLSGLG